MRLHTGSRPYKCHQCDHQFRTTGHLQAHVRSHVSTSKAKKSRRACHNSLIQPSSTNNSVKCSPSRKSPQLRPRFISSEILNQSAPAVQNVNYSACEQSIVSNGSSPIKDSECMQLLGSLQLSAENVQITALDGNLFQADDLLQSFILITPQDSTVMGSRNATDFNPTDIIGLEDGGLNLEAVANLSNAKVVNPSSATEPISLRNDVANLGMLGFTTLPISQSVPESNFPKTRHILMSGGDRDPFLSVASEIPMTGFTSSSIPQPCADDLQVVSGEKLNSKQCPDCGRGFSKPSQMLRHRRTHTGERPHTCRVCRNTFSQKSSLDTHVMFAHSEVRPFNCPQCQFKTVQKAALKKHCSRAHPELNWSQLLTELSAPSTSSGNGTIYTPSCAPPLETRVTTQQINITTGVREYH